VEALELDHLAEAGLGALEGAVGETGVVVCRALETVKTEVHLADLVVELQLFLSVGLQPSELQGFFVEG
jgi:hypothetical protein